ncbi:MAG: potassium channel protein [Nitrospirae bacterium]|nr:potassium channel protein [Nitrospirota bacterium]MBF0540989.1 potassium channel protein [Nitrospirota bacterium]
MTEKYNFELYSQFVYRRFIWTVPIFMSVLIIGTTGYYIISDGQASFIDCLYMTVITVTTIGFGEIIDLHNKPYGRVFTMFIALSGIGALTYILSSITAFIVGGELKEVYRRKKMNKQAMAFQNHYIVCGIEGVGHYIVKELIATNRPHIIVDNSEEHINELLRTIDEKVYIIGDAMDDNTLMEAGIERASGLFAVTGDDNHNLVICLSAKQLNPKIRVVVRCRQIKNMDKMRKVGADSIVSPQFIGGLRMASEMIRPATVSFLDAMLRGGKNLRVEDMKIPDTFRERQVQELKLEVLLMAIKTKDDDWIYNPSPQYIVKSGDSLIILCSPEERKVINSKFAQE